MKFLLLIHHGSDFVPPDSLDEETANWVAERESRDERVVGGRLRPPSEGVILSQRAGELVREAGPRTSDDVQIAGFDLIDCDDLDTAIKIVATHPMTERGAVEIRRIWMEDEDA